jgi:hypothetical protein
MQRGRETTGLTFESELAGAVAHRGRLSPEARLRTHVNEPALTLVPLAAKVRQRGPSQIQRTMQIGVDRPLQILLSKGVVRGRKKKKKERRERSFACLVLTLVLRPRRTERIRHY